MNHIGYSAWGVGVWDGGGEKVVELAKTMFLWLEDIVCLYVFNNMNMVRVLKIF